MAKKRRYTGLPNLLQNESCKQGVPFLIVPEEDETRGLITETLGMRSCWEQSIETLSLLLPYVHHFKRVQSDGDVCSFFTSRYHMLLFTFYFIALYSVEKGKLHTCEKMISTLFAL